MTVSFSRARTKRTRDGHYAGGLTAGQLARCFHLNDAGSGAHRDPPWRFIAAWDLLSAGYKTECRLLLEGA